MVQSDHKTSAWADFCDRMKAVGERILQPDFPQDPRTRAEGLRHLSRMMNYATQWYVEFRDPDFPAFHRYDDDIIKWGGPNADNHYLRARVSPASSYRITANVTGLRQMILSTPEGEMQFGQYRVFAEKNLDDLNVSPDGFLEVFLGGPERPGNWIPLHPDTDHVLIRLYVSDWATDAIPDFHIEKLGEKFDLPGPAQEQTISAALDQAAHWIETSIVYWKDYLVGVSERGPANRIGPPYTPPGGAADIAYGGGWYQLQRHEALLVEFSRPEAQYWSFQIYAPPFFESLDIAHRQVSLNHKQVHVDTDDRVRIILSASDPGVPNWLDTEGRESGMLSYRWIWADTKPIPESRVVPIADLRGALPDDTPVVTKTMRDEVLRARKAGIARRFHR